MNNYKLPDFCNYVMGQSPSSQFYNSNREGLPFLQGCTTFGRMFPTFDTWTTQYTRTCKPNDVLMSVRAPVGDLNISRDVIALGRGVAALSMKQGDNRYLFYLLMANRQKLSSCSTGTIYESISKTQLENIVFDVHEPEEQRHIVDILGSIDEKIENNERIMDLLIADLRLKYKSTFKNNSNQQVPLSYFIKDTIGGDWGKEQAGGNFLSKVICIRGTDIPELSTGRNGNPPTRFILSKNLETKKLEPWEIIIEISGGSPTQSTGRCALITHEMLKQHATPVICTNFCRAIKCKRNEYATYVFSVLSAMYNDNLFFNYENGTTGIKNLDLISILEKETVYLPSETELLSFFQYTENIYRQVEHFKFQNSKLNELKQLYLKKFFG